MPSFEEKKEESLSDKVKKNLENFLSRSDDPGVFLTPEEKIKLIKESLTDAGALKMLKKDRDNKYRTNSLSGAIGWASIFLTSEDIKNVPSDQKEKLLQRIEGVSKEIEKEKEKPLGYTKELVGEVVDIVKEVKKYLK